MENTETKLTEKEALHIGGVSIPLFLKSVKTSELKKGDVFLWRRGMTGKFEIHTFHSDSGYGAKTFTNFNEKDGSSELVNYSGICGVFVSNGC